jgi:hypothetical protein
MLIKTKAVATVAPVCPNGELLMSDGTSNCSTTVAWTSNGGWTRASDVSFTFKVLVKQTRVVSGTCNFVLLIYTLASVMEGTVSSSSSPLEMSALFLISTRSLWHNEPSLVYGGHQWRY